MIGLNGCSIYNGYSNTIKGFISPFQSKQLLFCSALAVINKMLYIWGCFINYFVISFHIYDPEDPTTEVKRTKGD